MATKKNRAAVTADMFQGLTEDETKQLISRFKRMALQLSNIATEFADVISVLQAPKAALAKSRMDSNDEPIYRYLTRVPIPEDIKLTKKLLDYAMDLGFARGEIPGIFANAVEYYRRTGTKWQDWTMVLQKWFRTDMNRRKQQSATAPRTSKSLPEYQ
jgi:hypothetical protein